jgi:hypothetical protein
VFALKQVMSMPSRRMVAVARKAREIVLSSDERGELERVVRASTSEQRMVQPATQLVDRSTDPDNSFAHTPAPLSPRQ